MKKKYLRYEEHKRIIIDNIQKAKSLNELTEEFDAYIEQKTISKKMKSILKMDFINNVYKYRRKIWETKRFQNKYDIVFITNEYVEDLIKLKVYTERNGENIINKLESISKLFKLNFEDDEQIGDFKKIFSDNTRLSYFLSIILEYCEEYYIVQLIKSKKIPLSTITELIEPFMDIKENAEYISELLDKRFPKSAILQELRKSFRKSQF